MSALLALSGLACRRGRLTLFSGLALALEAGQMLRIEGANGAGKTSLLRILCGLDLADGGQVLWRGKDIRALRDEFSRELLYIGHGAALKGELSALENLLSACAIAGECSTPAMAKAALAQAGLAKGVDLPVSRLSQGQKRRAVLARLELARKRTLWVLDEPFNALDAAGIAWVSAKVSEHLAQGGALVITSHQDLPFAAGAGARSLAL